MKFKNIVVLVLMVALVAGLVLYFANKKTNSGPTLKTEKGDVALDLAITNAEQEKGLSNRDSYPTDRGMLFVFETSDMWPFWMEDMKFAIDMIWLDENFSVVMVRENVSPDTYPETFVSDAPAKYVLEGTAGFAKAYDIEVGKTLTFNNINSEK